MQKILNKLNIFPALLIIMILGSCSKDFLKRVPADSLPSNVALNSESGLESALNGAYSDLRSVSLFGRDFPVIGDLHADNTYVEQKNAGRYLLWYNYTLAVSNPDASDMWTAAYTGILRANRIINADVTASKVAAIKAEAKGIRGLLYFQLVNMFATQYSVDPSAYGVPIVLEYDPYKLPSRNTVQEVYAQIISDLKDGFANAGPYTSSVRLSKYAIEGLLARAYLYMGDYANAKSAAADVINNSGFTLVSPANLVSYWSNSAARTDKV
ncbi:MAG: RagB/SusD family nutrient uptake outer membrane protein, partial [Bacteroidota bacterium]|nr:RagB/SusD family nutrient uptake outer membrane protein [Bacteroidota bacterium]